MTSHDLCGRMDASIRYTLWQSELQFAVFRCVSFGELARMKNMSRVSAARRHSMHAAQHAIRDSRINTTHTHTHNCRPQWMCITMSTRLFHFIVYWIEMQFSCNVRASSWRKIENWRESTNSNPVIREWHIVIAQISSIFLCHRFSISVFHRLFFWMSFLSCRTIKLPLNSRCARKPKPTVCAVRLGAMQTDNKVSHTFIYIVCIYP